MKAVFVTEPGGIDKLRLEEIADPTPGPDQVLVRIHYSGINFIDIYYRTGLYKADPPVVLGMEAAGLVEAVGKNVSAFKPGDRVAYAMARGSYAELAVVPAWQLVPVPDAVDLKVAAASMLQGMTAHYLTHSTWPLKIGETCLVHAAAGGAGQWIVAAARVRGARVIGTTSTPAKAEIARRVGCEDVILYTEVDFDKETRRLTGGKGVDVVYDSVGKTTFEQSLNCLRPRGMMVSFGNASGAVPAFEPLLLASKGSLFFTRPSLAAYAATREEIEWRAGDIFHWIVERRVTPHIHCIYPFGEAGQAHEDLAGRKTVGKLLLAVGAPA